VLFTLNRPSIPCRGFGEQTSFLFQLHFADLMRQVRKRRAKSLSSLSSSVVGSSPGPVRFLLCIRDWRY
jgi:hypothetical protein